MGRERGIKFYSEYDMSSGSYLQEAEAFFENWDENVNNADINTILELQNIKKYFDADMRLDRWTDSQFAAYKNKCKLVPEILGRFCNTISDSNFETFYKDVDRDYIDDFWQLVNDYKVYQRITSDVIECMVRGKDHVVWHILKHRNLVTTFGQVIAEHLVDNSHTAEELIFHYLAFHRSDRKPLYFPTEFTQEMKDIVLVDYVEREDANINSLQLLEQAQSSKEFPVSDKLKLRARKRKEALQEKLFVGRTGLSYGAQVTFKSIPDGSIEETYNDNVICCAYSLEWLEENQDFPTLLNNFIYLFGYVDRCFRCTFISLQNELGVLERHLGVKGKRDYATGIVFNTKKMLSLLQMNAYKEELERLNIRIEDIFKWFFEDYLKNEFGAQGFTYSPPSAGTTYVEKCKLLAIAIDGALKQYRLFCEDGLVDRELLEMSSGHIVFSELMSHVENKYAYSNSTELQTEMFLLFSDQSMMNYTEKTRSTYQTFPQLLMSVDVKREDFAHFQQRDLNWLIKRGAVQISDEGYLKINKARTFVLKDLFQSEVICPTYYVEELRQQVEELVAAGDMCYESTLFTKVEQDYLNYALNKSEFTNGLDLRNKYSHDTCSLDEKIQRQDYMELLKIMILVIIKINEEFCINNKDIEPKDCTTLL